MARYVRAAIALWIIVVTAASFPGWYTTATEQPPAPAGVTISGLDAHDGTVVRDGATYYLYGTRYACGFHWGTPSPFCGFGVWSSSALSGPWTFVRNLFPVTDGDYAWGWATWSWVCAGHLGGGCFNPRMIKKSEGLWILYFNAPDDMRRGAGSAYYAMGCVSPAGPCGDTAGGVGSTRRMPMSVCRKNGDFSVFVDGQTPYLVCSDGAISIEQLDYWWTSGTSPATSVNNIAYLSGVEAPGVYHAASGEWVMTLSDPMCGYCAGTGTAYITSANGPLGVWLAPANPGAAATVTGRSKISGNSCGGQPRTVFTMDGQPWQWIDTWYGDTNETRAAIQLEPLVQTGPLRVPADGKPWVGGFRPFGCGSGG